MNDNLLENARNIVSLAEKINSDKRLLIYIDERVGEIEEENGDGKITITFMGEFIRVKPEVITKIIKQRINENNKSLKEVLNEMKHVSLKYYILTDDE